MISSFHPMLFEFLLQLGCFIYIHILCEGMYYCSYYHIWWLYTYKARNNVFIYTFIPLYIHPYICTFIQFYMQLLIILDVGTEENYMIINQYICIHTCTTMQMNIYINMNRYINMNIDICRCAQTHTHMRPHLYTFMQSQLGTHTQSHLGAHKQSHIGACS